jgi:hypothetical protein
MPHRTSTGSVGRTSVRSRASRSRSGIRSISERATTPTSLFCGRRGAEATGDPVQERQRSRPTEPDTGHDPAGGASASGISRRRVVRSPTPAIARRQLCSQEESGRRLEHHPDDRSSLDYERDQDVELAGPRDELGGPVDGVDDPDPLGREAGRVVGPSSVRIASFGNARSATSGRSGRRPGRRRSRASHRPSRRFRPTARRSARGWPRPRPWRRRSRRPAPRCTARYRSSRHVGRSHSISPLIVLSHRRDAASIVLVRRCILPTSLRPPSQSQPRSGVRTDAPSP